MLFGHKKCEVLTPYHMDEPQKHANGRSQSSNSTFRFYKMSKVGESIETESRSVLA